MSAASENFADLRIPPLPGHGGLAPSNCLVDGSSIGVIDWEGGSAQLLLASTLADFAAGEAGTAHGHRDESRRNWSGLLAVDAENFRASPLRR